MPRYFFHIQDGRSLPDAEGTELADLNTARKEAVSLAGTVIAESVKRPPRDEAWALDVTDEDGLVLFKLGFTVTESPAALADPAR